MQAKLSLPVVQSTEIVMYSVRGLVVEPFARGVKPLFEARRASMAANVMMANIFFFNRWFNFDTNDPKIRQMSI